MESQISEAGRVGTRFSWLSQRVNCNVFGPAVTRSSNHMLKRETSSGASRQVDSINNTTPRMPLTNMNVAKLGGCNSNSEIASSARPIARKTQPARW